MKKKLMILSAMTVLGSPWALAQSQITTSPLPPVQIQQELNPTIDISGFKSEENSLDLNSAIQSALAEAETSVIRTYQYIKHVDLRDITKYDRQMAIKLPDDADRLPGTSRKILEAIAESPERFAGTDVVYYEDGAKGPSGRSAFMSQRGRNEFVITKRYPETQTNTIFSADYITAAEVAPNVIEAKLLLFIHSASQGYYFRKLSVRVDWKKNKTHAIEDVVSVISVDQDISLSETNFKMKGSLSAQKIILEDTNWNITKVFPVTVGAIDARSNSVESMTFWVPEKQRRSARTDELKQEFQDFSNAALIKRSVWDADFNTAERLYPSYYSGRPFIALIDMNYVSESPNFSAGYREIGLHYQITEPNLERGFKSHGCVRVRDKDLYQLDAIVNHGPRDTVKAAFMKRLPNHLDINHPHTYESQYSKVAYTNFRSEIQSESIACKYRESGSYQYRSVRWNTEDKDYHTLIDEDCLTRVFKTDNPADEVRDFWANRVGSWVGVHVVNIEHSPVTKARETLLTYNYHPATIDSMDHKQRLKTAYDIKQGTIAVNNGYNTGFSNNTNLTQGNTIINRQQTTIWRSHGIHKGNIVTNTQYRGLHQRMKADVNAVSRAHKILYYRYLYYQNCISLQSSGDYSICSIFEDWVD